MNSRQPILSIGFLATFFASASVLAAPGELVINTAFAQLSSLNDQSPGNLVRFEQRDSVLNMSVTDNSVEIKKDGSYLVIASPQVTATKDGGCLNAWILLNGKGVANSGVRLCQAKAGNTNVLVSQVIMYLRKGDMIQVKTNGVNSKLDAIQNGKNPAIPAIILTITGLF
jgi:hypothetical protein